MAQDEASRVTSRQAKTRQEQKLRALILQYLKAPYDVSAQAFLAK